LKPEVDVIFKNSVPTSQKTHRVPIGTTEQTSLSDSASDLHMASVRLESAGTPTALTEAFSMVFLSPLRKMFG
jgi:hypothetical protein